MYRRTAHSRRNGRALSEANLRIEGTAAGDLAGTSVAGAGDQNGAGRADVVVGDGLHDLAIGLGFDSADVIFGRAGPPDVDLANIGDRGFKIQSELNAANLGTVAAAAGDVNGDGKADVVVSDGRTEFRTVTWCRTRPRWSSARATCRP